MGNTVEANPKVADGKKYRKREKYSLKTRVLSHIPQRGKEETVRDDS
jgi:hypothetical protein